jgi:hypothetical protein
MQYVLGLAILCKKYKKNPIVRLFIDNKFIDEFIIDDTTKLFNGPLWGWRSTRDPTQDGELRLSFANKYKIFDIDGKIFKNNSKITFEIQNKDSNYVNGFITKSTVIAMHNIFLIPKSLLKRYKLIYKAFYKHRWIYKEEERLQKGWAGWPSASVGRQFNKPTVFNNSWIGDNATIEYNVQKKHGIYMFFEPEQKEYEFLCLSRLISGLCSFENFDKYLHEN